MATAWLASAVDGHGAARPIVVKTILSRLANDERFRTCFFREGGIASRVSHRNVARVFDLGEDHGVLFIAMEFVDGPSLNQVLRACRAKQVLVPYGVLLRILTDTCQGLHAAHELRDGTGRPLNVVHRDMSPSNILITSKGVAKVIDFGVAKAQRSFAPDALLVGKEAYIPPEQALGQAVDRRADLWALGAIIYRASSGRKAFDSPNWQARLEWLASGRPPLPLPASVHPAIAAIARRSLSFAPSDRYATAQDMARALEQAALAVGATASAADVAAFCSTHVALDPTGQSPDASASEPSEPRTGEAADEGNGEAPGIFSAIRRLWTRR
jgi:serine/threonine-protein kinase